MRATARNDAFMNLRKNTLFLIGGTVALLLLLAISWLLYGIRRLNKAQVELEQKRLEFASFYQKNPFPSSRNLEREKSNFQEYNEWHDRLRDELAQGRIDTESEKSPSIFMSFLGEQKNRLVEHARRKNVTLPSESSFGFERYFAADGILPVPTMVPRLTQQFILMKDLCEILFDERIKSLTFARRDEFEVAQRARDGVGSPIKLKEEPLNSDAGGVDASVFRFEFSFVSDERSLTGILNRLAAHPTFIVVSSLRMEKSGSDMIAPAVARPVPLGVSTAVVDQAAGDMIPSVRHLKHRNERIACGNTREIPMNVTLIVDVYQFGATK